MSILWLLVYRLTLFSVFLYDLANLIKSEKLGIDIGSKNIGILMYADDVADENKPPERN